MGDLGYFNFDGPPMHVPYNRPQLNQPKDQLLHCFGVNIGHIFGLSRTPLMSCGIPTGTTTGGNDEWRPGGDNKSLSVPRSGRREREGRANRRPGSSLLLPPFAPECFLLFLLPWEVEKKEKGEH